MPRYEFKEGTSSKFWEIELDGTSFTTRYGKIGTDGQETSKSWPSPAEAKKQYDKLVAEKVKKGYQLVDGSGGSDGDGEGDAEPAADLDSTIRDSPRAKTAKKSTEKSTEKAAESAAAGGTATGAKPAKAAKKVEGGGGASSAELELTIDKEADNTEAYQVYADWLQAQGDPRGELITFAVSALTSKDLKLKSREKSLREAQMGKLADHAKSKALALTYKYGLIETARLHLDYETESETDAAGMISDLCGHPLARFLRSIRLGIVDTDGENAYDAVIDAMAKAGPRSALRELFIGDFKYPDETEMSWSYIKNLEKLYPLLPRLRSLTLQSGNLKLGNAPIPLAPRLRSLDIRSGGLDGKSIQAIVGTEWPKLEKLHLWFGSDDYGAEGDLAMIKPILDGKNFPALKQLGLMNSQFADDIAGAIGDAKVLPQLKTLDLSLGTMTDAGATALAASKKSLAHLAILNVSNNYLSKGGIKSVTGLCAQVVSGGQRDDDDEERYVSVGE